LPGCWQLYSARVALIAGILPMNALEQAVNDALSRLSGIQIGSNCVVGGTGKIILQINNKTEM